MTRSKGIQKGYDLSTRAGSSVFDVSLVVCIGRVQHV